jgi:hypothetical protein
VSVRTGDVFSRRDLVVLAVTIVAGGVVLTVGGCNGSEPTKGPAEPADLVLPAGFTELASMRIVGKRYLELHPEETLAKLLAVLKPSRGFPALDVEIRKQYASGEVVHLAGWVIALTEARIYAVVALRA